MAQNIQYVQSTTITAASKSPTKKLNILASALGTPMCLNPLGKVPRILKSDFLRRPRFTSQVIRVYGRIGNTVLSVDRKIRVF